jgi:hypothetical protein
MTMIKLRHPTTRNEPQSIDDRQYYIDGEGFCIVQPEHEETLVRFCGFERVCEVDGVEGQTEVMFPRSKEEFFDLCKRISMRPSDLREMASLLEQSQRPAPVSIPKASELAQGITIHLPPVTKSEQPQEVTVSENDSKDRLLEVCNRLEIETSKLRRARKSKILETIARHVAV